MNTQVPESTPGVAFPVLTNDVPGVRVSQVVQLSQNLGRATVGHDGTYISYAPFAKTFGTDRFIYSVTNGSGGADSAWVTVNIRAKPTVEITAPYGDARFSTNVNIGITNKAVDWDGVVTNVTMFTNGVPYKSLTTNSSGYWITNWATSLVGFYTFETVATDNEGFTNISDSITVIITNGFVGAMPVAAITNLVATTTVSYGLEFSSFPVVRDGLFNLRGHAYDPDAGDAVAYKVLLFRPEDYDVTIIDATSDLNELIYIVEPYADVTPGPLNYQGFHTNADDGGNLGDLDLTAIPNGIYDLVLRVRGGTDETNAIVRVQIESNLKIGQFSFSEQDLAIPVNGIPLTVVRTYNSMNARSADFGYSWTYALNSMDVELNEQRQDVVVGTDGTPYADGEDDDFGPQRVVNIRTGGDRDVTLTLPDGRRTTFVFTPKFSPSECKAYAEWKAPPGVTATLKPSPLVSGEINLIPTWPPFWQNGGYPSTFEN